jgi:hypothetical protein
VHDLGDDADALLRDAGVDPGSFLTVDDLRSIPPEHHAVLQQIARELDAVRRDLSDAPG